MLDTNSFSFSNFVNQNSGDYSTSTPGGNNNFFHNQAGDLHTPGMAFQLGTPLSSNDSHSVSAVDMQAFQSHLLHQQPFHDHRTFHPQQSFAPSSFIHRDSGYETMAGSTMNAPLQKLEEHQEAGPATFDTRQYQEGPVSQMPSLEK